MNLYSKIDLPEVKDKVSYASSLFFLGSCFAENIGDKYQENLFKVMQNPFGVLFHPFAIENFLKLVANPTNINKNLLLQTPPLWKSYEAHSSICANQQEDLIALMQDKLICTKKFLHNSSHVFVSLGSAWGYFLGEEAPSFVVNCHKQPNYLFQKKIASVTEVEKSIQQIITSLNQLTKAKIWFTISPVRHKKDGWTENTRSKANLISALHNCLAKNPEVNYFPAYELMMDELRDYRFYSKDLVHPNELAIEVIWQKIIPQFLDKESQQLLKKVHAYLKLKQHKSLSPATANAHQEKLTILREDLIANKIHIS